jgi:hypothetical protein
MSKYVKYSKKGLSKAEKWAIFGKKILIVVVVGKIMYILL